MPMFPVETTNNRSVIQSESAARKKERSRSRRNNADIQETMEVDNSRIVPQGSSGRRSRTNRINQKLVQSRPCTALNAQLNESITLRIAKKESTELQ